MKNEKKLVSQADIFATLLQLMHVKPQYAIDGVSLMDALNRNRVVTCSEYMPTFHNNPTAVVVDTALQTRYIDFLRKSVTDSKTGRTYPYRKLSPFIRKIIDFRLHRKSAVGVSLNRN